MTFKSFSNSQTSCLGKICLKVRIQTEAMHVSFYVVDKHHEGFAVLLGRSWMCSTNCQINLRTRNYTLEVNSVNLTGKSSEENLPTKEETSVQATSLVHTQTSQQKHSKQKESGRPHNPVQGRRESQDLFYWRPKDATQQPHQPSKTQVLPPT